MWKAEVVPALGQPSAQLWHTALMPHSSEAPSLLMPPQSPRLVSSGDAPQSQAPLDQPYCSAVPELLLTARLSSSSCGSLIRQNQLLEPRFETRYPGHFANSCLSPTTASLSQLSFAEVLFSIPEKVTKLPPGWRFTKGWFSLCFYLLAVQSRHSWSAAWQHELLPAWAL